MAPSQSLAQISLPALVVSRVDVGRLLRELEAIDEQLLQLGLRHSGAATQLPKTSRLLEETAELNKCNLLQADDRHQLRQLLETVRQRAPLLHVSFSADPSPVFLGKLVSWLRQEINPHVLLTIGLQPNIGAGCVVRSTNKYFDFSLRQNFAQKHDLLKAALTPAAPVAEAPHG